MNVKMSFWTLLALGIGIQGTLAIQNCYECSSKSALCRKSVYDGHYLSKTNCKSRCFYRTQNNRIYRGCFDGWVGGIVNSHYLGCRVQEYLGEKVEWCFCKSTKNDQDNPCNGADRETIDKFGVHAIEQEILEEEEDQLLESAAVLELRDSPGDELYEEIGGKLVDNEVELNSDLKFEFEPRYRQPEGRKARLDGIGENVDAEPLYEEEEIIFDHPQYDFEYVSSICHGRHDGTYQDVTDCSRYFHCTNGRPYRMTCPKATLWNDKLKTCTFNLDPDRPDPCSIPEHFNYYIGYGAHYIKPFLLPERAERQEILNASPPND